MAKNFYNDAPEADASNQPGQDTESPAEDKAEGGEGKEKEGDAGGDMVGKAFFKGKVPDPGQTCTVKVVHHYGDQVEIQYVGPTGEKPAMSQAFDRMDEMAGQKGGEQS